MWEVIKSLLRAMSKACEQPDEAISSLVSRSRTVGRIYDRTISLCECGRLTCIPISRPISTPMDRDHAFAVRDDGKIRIRKHFKS